MSASISGRRSARGRRTGRVLAAAATSALLGATMVTPANATLSAVGAPDNLTGYPTFYKDAANVKVDYCVDDAMCLGGDTRPDTTKPAAVATGNLPDEAFYASAEAEVTLNGGGRIRWRAVVEGAWLAEEVVDGEQMTFTRIQLTGSKIPLNRYPAGTVLTAHTPYGPIAATVDRKGNLTRNRKESAPGTKENGFKAPLAETRTGYGPKFLKWTGTLPVSGGRTFLGDPEVEHTVTGASTGNANAVRVFRGTTAVSPRVTEFSVSGRIAVS